MTKQNAILPASCPTMALANVVDIGIFKAKLYHPKPAIMWWQNLYLTLDQNKNNTDVPQKDRVARRLLSSGGAHLLQIPWQAG